MAEHRRIANLKGPRGEQGKRGALGPAPDFGIGDVTTVTDTTDAAARIRGSAENPILDLDIPRGIPAADVAPTDESVAAMVSTQGTDSHSAALGTADRAARTLDTDTQHMIYGENEAGDPTIVQGDPDQITYRTIGSLTKLMTALVLVDLLREIMGSDDIENVLDAHIEYTQYDADNSVGGVGSPFSVGDSISIRDHLYAMMLPSNNMSPNAVARFVGYNLQEMNPPDWYPYSDHLSGDARRVALFVHRMNEKANELGYVFGYGVARFVHPVAMGRMSAAQIADLIRRCRADEVLRPILAANSRQVEVSGSNARTVTIFSLDWTSTSLSFPEKLAYKGGTHRGQSHNAMIWEHPTTGEEHVTVVMNVRGGAVSRFQRLRDAMDATIAGRRTFNPARLAGTAEEDQTIGPLDITHKFSAAGVVRPDGLTDAGIFLLRDGNTVQLNIRATFDGPFALSGLIPLGFRPAMSCQGLSVFSGTSNMPRAVYVTAAGAVQMTDTGSPGTFIRCTMTWITPNFFPSVPWDGRPGSW